MTNRVDRLETRGLVRRRADPADRRGVLVALTSAGQEAVDEALADLLDRERDLLGSLAEPDRPRLAALLRTLLAQFDQVPRLP
jgi:DNA-binding MarR family transcriptional regulator